MRLPVQQAASACPSCQAGPPDDGPYRGRYYERGPYGHPMDRPPYERYDRYGRFDGPPGTLPAVLCTGWHGRCTWCVPVTGLRHTIWRCWLRCCPLTIAGCAPCAGPYERERFERFGDRDRCASTIAWQLPWSERVGVACGRCPRRLAPPVAAWQLLRIELLLGGWWLVKDGFACAVAGACINSLG